MEIRPYESASEIVNQAQSWGVLDCICRTQKALIGQPCEHPLDMCMVFSHVPGAFDYHPVIRALDHQQALETLTRAAKAGLVHTVSNNQRGTWYLCNCCTCSCGILRGIAEMGLANAVAHSAFVNVVNQNLCTGCELCVEWCQFSALSLQEGLMQINALRCVGCGVCVPNCPENALSLLRRNEEEILSIPLNELEWFASRANARGRDLGEVL
jgi:heterodisulfide reductase subunit A-like polyferredoxin